MLLVCLLACVAAGCGTQHYQQRLEATRQQFAFFAELNANLAPPWQEKGLTLRVPHGFRLAWEPDAKDGPAEPPGSEFFPNELTGLVGVWTADLPADRGTRPGYLYVLTNHDLWLDEDRRDEAGRFFEAVIDRDLRGMSGLPADYRSQKHWRVPSTTGESYLPKRFYSRADFPGIRSEDGEEATLHIGNFKAEDAEVVLLFLVPAGARLTGVPSSVDPVELTMKTLTAQAQRPRPQGEKKPQGTGGF